ncbi:MAG: hypothetical protein DKT66_10245 [Candidatus Melainabacteria bacterium]|nr:MAG: hypothetical protein DKT66_10245 [Candidatus Melainabacteria bacterium]
MAKNGFSSDFPASIADGAQESDFGIDMRDQSFNTILSRVANPSESTSQFVLQEFSIANDAKCKATRMTSNPLAQNTNESQAVVNKLPRLSIQNTFF